MFIINSRLTKKAALLSLSSLFILSLFTISSLAYNIAPMASDVNMGNSYVNSQMSQIVPGVNSSVGTTTNSSNGGNSMMMDNPSMMMDNSGAMMNSKGYSTMMDTTMMQNSSTENNSVSKDTFEISKIDGNKFTLVRDGKTTEALLNDNIKLTKNGSTAKISDLKTQDQVTLSKDSSGAIIAVEVVAREVFDAAKYIIPGLILLILLAGLAYYLYSRMNKGHIKTQATKIQ